MNRIFSDASKACGIDKQVLRRTKDYIYYKGNGWDNGNPLLLVKGEKFKDRISPTFNKLVTIIDDLYKVNKINILNEYISALNKLGISLDFSEYSPDNITKDEETSDSAIRAGVGIQEDICRLADDIKDEDSIKAEKLGFGPKNEYLKLLNLIYSKNNGKDIDDKCQDKFVNLQTAMNSYTMIQDSNI